MNEGSSASQPDTPGLSIGQAETIIMEPTGLWKTPV
jgi:hypothetical protein